MSSVRSARPALVVSLVLLLTVVAGCIAVSGWAPAGPSSPPTADAGRPSATQGGDAADSRARSPYKGPMYGAQLAALPPLADIRQDEGNSVALPDGRTLYIFADTLHLHTPPKFFASSSAAITHPKAPLRLEFASDPAGVPREFLPREPDERANQVNGVRYTAVWPTGATNLPDGRTIISYGKYDMVVQPQWKLTLLGAGLYEYRYTDAKGFRGGGIARRIADDIWSPRDGAVGSPLYRDGYVYFTQCENLECYSLRTTPDRLGDRSSYRWRTSRGWSAERADRSPMLFGESRPGHNPSVVWVPSLKAYVMADTAAGDVSFEGLLWVAPKPWGPWSTPVKVALPRCSGGGCYGLNVHAAQSTAKSIRISYSPVMVNRIGPFVYLLDQPVRVSSGARRISAGF